MEELLEKPQLADIAYDPSKVTHGFKKVDLIRFSQGSSILIAICGVGFTSGTYKEWEPKSEKEFCPTCWVLAMGRIFV